MSTEKLSMSEAINAGIRHEMRRDKNIVLLGQDIGTYGGTFGVYKGLFTLLSEAPVILGLDGGQKMSKSRNNAVML